MNRFPHEELPSTVNVPIGSQLASYFANDENLSVGPEPVIVPPTWNKADYHQTLTRVWSAAAQHLAEAEYIFVIGYSLPETDSFFRHLYALGSVGDKPLRKFAVFNPDSTGAVDKRFRDLLGPGATSRYEYHERNFRDAIYRIQGMFHKKNLVGI